MADFTLSNGDEITFDLDKLTLKEWQEMKNPAFAQEEEYITISKISGIKLELISAMTMGEYKRLFKKLVKKIQDPLSDPN
ncbi:MAG: hypothetical protein WC998_08385 [Candidatus Paceibacterota bacterium]|jgi:hypothetical protein